MNKLRGTAIAILAVGALACAALVMAQAGEPSREFLVPRRCSPPVQRIKLNVIREAE